MWNPMSGHGLCPAGLVPAGGKSGVKVTAASTVRDGASLIPSIPSWPRGTPSSTGSAGFSRYGRGRNGCD